MFIINTENRPDLAVGISRNALTGNAQFIAPRLFPAMKVAEKAGTIACAQIIRGTAVKNRTAGTDLTGTRVAPLNVAYTTNSYEGRDYLTDTDIKDAGGLESAIAAAALGAGYDTIKLVESDAAATLFSAARYTAAGAMTAAAPFDAISAAADSVSDYGTPVLVASKSWLREFVKLGDVVKVLVDLYGHGVIGGLQNGVSDVMKAVGSTLGVSDILIGADAFWKVTGKTDAAAVVALRPDEMAVDVRSTIKKLPCYGFAPTFLPEQDSTLDDPFAVSTVYLPGTKESAVDVDLFSICKEINADAAKLIKLPAA